jgi:DegV family protein with EDD domain
MGKIKLFADASCDLPAEFIKANDIDVVGIYVNLNDEDGLVTVPTERELASFFDKMKKGGVPKTSRITYDRAIETFEPAFKNGDDVIFMGLSSGLCLPAYEEELKAGLDLAKKYGVRFYAPDMKLVSVGTYLVFKKVVELINNGASFDDIMRTLPEFFANIREYFTVETLTYLYKGGRLSATSKIVGNLINIKPILTVTEEGKLDKKTQVIGRTKSLATLTEYIKNIDTATNAVIVHAFSPDDAGALRDKIYTINPKVTVEICNIGYIIGAHTGPGAIGLVFREK